MTKRILAIVCMLWALSTQAQERYLVAAITNAQLQAAGPTNRAAILRGFKLMMHSNPDHKGWRGVVEYWDCDSGATAGKCTTINIRDLVRWADPRARYLPQAEVDALWTQTVSKFDPLRDLMIACGFRLAVVEKQNIGAKLGQWGWQRRE